MKVLAVGRHGNIIKALTLPPGCESICIPIYDDPADARGEHFPACPAFPDWIPGRKVSDLPDPPTEVR